MAYGVKFRLEFSDDNLKGKKVEILQDGYTGSVLDLVGTESPVEIIWDSDDDFYNPVIGSTCNINLFATDDTNYDDFYNADEREYKVKISYKDTSDAYQTYWEGWLLVDQFKEAVTTTPFGLTLTAYDGLGSLEGYTAPIDLTSVSSKDLMYYIYNILNNINLGFDIYISNDIQKNGALATDYTIYDQATVSQTSFLKDGADLRTAKNVLEQILKFTNAKIFQSFGKWYIINNSSYSEQAVKDSSATSADGGTIPTGIRASETSSLQTNGYEQIKYFIYNSSGVYQSTSTVDVLNTVPGDLKPLGNNLTKEYLRPLKEYAIDVEVGDNFFNTNVIVNPGFEHGSTRWTLTNSSIDTELTFKGNRSLKTTNVQTSASGTSVTLVNSQGIDQAPSSTIAWKLIVNNYFDSVSSNTRGFRWQIKLVETGPGATQTKYWNHGSTSWTDTATINDQPVDTNRRWKKYSYTIDSLPSGNAWDIFIYLYDPYQTTSTSGFTAMYYDSISFEYENIDSDGNRSEFFSKFDLLKFVRSRTADYSGVKTADGFYLTNDKYGRVSGDYYRSRDKTNYLKSIEEITTQQVINDYRSYVLRYEGDLYNNNTLPIGPHNKIWVNFGSSVLQEPVSCYIDGISYDVKRNLYSIIMHVPNQDDDITSDFIVKF